MEIEKILFLYFLVGITVFMFSIDLDDMEHSIRIGVFWFIYLLILLVRWCKIAVLELIKEIIK
jgi:hypothetical protein